MKLIYRVKFRAWGITFGTTSGEVDLADKIPNVHALTGIAAYLDEFDHEAVLVNERGVYIAIVMD
jgi:hypothetical protein